MNRLPLQLPLAPLPGRFARAQLCAPDHPDRSRVETFIAAIYRERFGAQFDEFFPHLVAYYDVDDNLLAAVGLRCGREGRLFVEHYLDEPIEHALSHNGLAHVARDRIAEAGNFAARTPGIARELILQLAWLLWVVGMDWVAFVATRQLRNAFHRLHLAPVELAIAQAERLGERGLHWGSYYDTQPKVMCGNLLHGIDFLRGRASPPVPAAELQRCCAGSEA